MDILSWTIFILFPAARGLWFIAEGRKRGSTRPTYFLGSNLTR